MKSRCVFASILPVTLLLMAAGSGLARGPQALHPANTASVGAGTSPNDGDSSPAAAAPWFIETVDPSLGAGWYASMVIDGESGATYISYYDTTHKDLKLASYVGSGGNCGADHDWSCRTVDDSGDVGKYSSIALDPTTRLPAIAYWSASPCSLRLARAWSGGWDIVTVDDTCGRYASLKIDATGAAHIAYHTGSLGLLYARSVSNLSGDCGGNNFDCDLIHYGNGVGEYPSLALDASGRPRIAYYDAANDDLWYAQSGTPANCGPGNSWLCHAIAVSGDVGRYASLDLGNGNVPHIAYYDATDGKLMHARYVGGGSNCGILGSWRCEEIDSMGTGSHTRDVSLAVDQAGSPVIAYHKYIVGTQFSIVTLSVARPAAALGLQSGNCGPGNLWQCDRIPDSGHSGDYSALALHPCGLATIAYLNTEYFGMLRVAYQRFHQVFLPLLMKNQ